MGSIAAPEETEPVEVVPLSYQHVTGIGTIGTAEDRVYVTFTERQPGIAPGRTIPVVISKLQTKMENLPHLLRALQAAYDQWARGQGRVRGN